MKSLAKLGSFLTWKWGALLTLLAISAVAFGMNEPDKSSSGRVPLPFLEKGKGDHCVEDEEFMRRNHMKLLLHQRDETVHQGIRTKKYSLQNCIDCHASKKNNSVLGSNQNFCQSCHSYAAVRIDCFECHANKPKASTAAVFHPIIAPDASGGTHGLGFSIREHMGADLTKQTVVGAGAKK